MVAVLRDGLSAWLDQLMAVPSTHPIACALIGLAWIGSLSLRSLSAAAIATLLAVATLIQLSPLQAVTPLWAVLAVVLLANALLALQVLTWRNTVKRKLDSMNDELSKIRSAYEGEVHWRMAAYRVEASKLATSEVPIADLTERVEMLARQLNASRMEAVPEKDGLATLPVKRPRRTVPVPQEQTSPQR